MSSKLVVDASVALKWFFDDETDIEAARELLARWTGREIEFVVPSHWPLEVLNGILSRIVKKLIDPARAHDLAKDFVAMNVVPTDITVHAAQIYETAIAFDRTTYVSPRTIPVSVLLTLRISRSE